MSADLDISDRIARLEPFEERFGVTLDALSARLEYHQRGFNEFAVGGTVRVFGEVHSRTGQTIPSSVLVRVGVYDLDGRVMASSLGFLIDARTFFLVEPFQLDRSIPVQSVSRVLVYPSPA